MSYRAENLNIPSLLGDLGSFFRIFRNFAYFGLQIFFSPEVTFWYLYKILCIILCILTLWHRVSYRAVNLNIASQFVTYGDQTNGIICLHENMRNERLMQKETPITDPLYRSLQCLQPFLIVQDSHQFGQDHLKGNLWWEPFHQCRSPDLPVAPGRGWLGCI